MTPEQISRAITELVGEGVEIDTLQAILLVNGRYVEIKARRATDQQWIQGMVKLEGGTLWTTEQQ